VGDLVWITKRKVIFAKGREGTYPTQILRIVELIQRMPQPLSEILNLQDLLIEGQFYNYEFVKKPVWEMSGCYMRVRMVSDQGTRAKVIWLRFVRISRIHWTRELGQTR